MGFAQLTNLITNPQALAKFFGFAPIIVGDIIVDVLRTETPIYDFEITQHPVEAGLDITDNRIKRPTGVILDCILSDTTLDPASITAAVTAGVLTSGFPPLTWQAKWAALLELSDKNDILTAFTPLATYENMMIKSLRMSQTKDTATAAFVTIELIEVRTVSSEVNVADSSQIPKKVKEQEKPENKEAGKKTSKLNNKGKQGTEETSSKNTSTLRSLVQGL